MSKQSRVDVENERVEWIWRISEEDIYLSLPQKLYLCNVETRARCLKMSRRCKFGVGGVSLEWVE